MRIKISENQEMCLAIERIYENADDIRDELGYDVKPEDVDVECVVQLFNAIKRDAGKLLEFCGTARKDSLL